MVHVPDDPFDRALAQPRRPASRRRPKNQGAVLHSMPEPALGMIYQLEL